jgi:hypothetical protein
MNIPFYCYPKKNLRFEPIILMLAELTFVHVDEQGREHKIPKHVAEVLDLPVLLDQMPDDSEFIYYMDEKGKIEHLRRDSIEFPKPEWGWNGARSALLSDSGPNDAVMISRASKVEGGPAATSMRGPQA